MDKKILTLFLLNFNLCFSLGQEINGIDSLEWKVFENVKNLHTESINRIAEQSNKITDLFWFDDESIGKCVVSFTPAEFNRKLNLAFNIEDSTSTPFKINFRWFHYDKPEDGSNFEKSYFISDSLANSEIDLHTLTINNVIPLGFQIYFENNYFSSRMFTDDENEIPQYFYPVNQTLMQETTEFNVKGILMAEYNFSGNEFWQNHDLHQFGELFKVQIQYQFKMKNE